MVILLSLRGFEAAGSGELQGAQSAQPWVRPDMLLLMFSLAGHTRPLRASTPMLLVLQSVGGRGAGLARRGGGAVLAGGRVLLPAVVKLMYFDEPQTPRPVRAHLDMSVLLLSPTPGRTAARDPARAADAALPLLDQGAVALPAGGARLRIPVA